MIKRDPYIKPSLLRLEFTQDVAQECPISCKTNTSANGQCLSAGNNSCQDSACSAVIAS